MFLAIKEIAFTKTRYILIIFVIVLTTYLTIFLSGLAYGLANDNRSSIDALHADGIILSSDANNAIAMSFISPQQSQQVKADALAELAVTPVILKSSENGITSYIFALNPDQFTRPAVVEGRMFKNPNEVVVDKSLQTKYGYALNDQITFTNLDATLKIVGFTKDTKYNTAPVIYMNVNEYHDIVRMPAQSMDAKSINAIAYQGEVTITSNQLKALSTAEFINDIPGYRPQVLTFTLMISFLIGIVSFVLSIFMYVLTIQKQAMFGVMKAQGITNKTILGSVLSQTFVLTLIGISIGMFLTALTMLFLPKTVPFAINIPLLSLILGCMFIFTLFGSLFSARSAIKVDPLIAMGG